MKQDHPMTPNVLASSPSRPPEAGGLSMNDLIKRLRIKAGMIQMGERIAWGSETDLMYEAADMIERMLASEEQYTPGDMASQAAQGFRDGQEGMYTAEDMADQGAQGWRDGYAWAKGEGCPEGYVMVPVKPTPEMLSAASGGSQLWGEVADECYRAMLAAAPQPPAAPGVSELVEALRRVEMTRDERLRAGSLSAAHWDNAVDACIWVVEKHFAIHQKLELSDD